MTRLFAHPLYRHFAYGVSFALINLSVPLLLPSLVNTKVFVLAMPKSQSMKPSRILSVSEMRKSNGKDGENPYLSGQQKWDMTYKNVDMFTGNFTQSVTDLDFQGGYGIPVSVQRTYSANNGDDGPFGPGWSLSADVRTTAGGLLKSGKAPVIAVPTTFKEKPLAQSDPRINTQPAAGVTVSDAGGNEETVQRDVDGVLTTPQWDQNVMSPTYQIVTFNNQVYQIQSGNQTNTPEGTVYTYAKEGSYPSGIYPAGNSNGALQPSNVLKCTNVVDRQGNVTSYTYSSDYATFNKANGQSSEHKLTSVTMPNGHILTFTWNTFNDGIATHFRITSASDNGGRTVQYNYLQGGQPLSGVPLLSFTTPGGKTTTYTYGGPDLTLGWTGDATPTTLLKSITDCRGLTTQIQYYMDHITLEPYGADVTGPLVARIVAPNGNTTVFAYLGQHQYPLGGSGNVQAAYHTATYEFLGAPSTDTTKIYQSTLFSTYTDNFTTSVGTVPVYVALQQLLHPLTPGGPPYAIVGVLPAGSRCAYQTRKIYDGFSENLYETDTVAERTNLDGQWTCDQLATFNDYGWTVTKNEYNFMGKPLWETTDQFEADSNNVKLASPPEMQFHKEYAYWDGTKYWQQKAVVDRIPVPDNGSSGRTSYTDYYASTAGAGSRGQAYRTYISAFDSFNNTRATDSSWKNDIVPADSTKYVTQSNYDSSGRRTDVWKLQSMGIPWAYVQTHTDYGTNTDGSWGQPSQVTEDYGAGKINRVTKTLAYDSSGQATVTQDASGHQFTTTYANADYQVDHIARTDNSQNIALATYAYGTGADNGQVLSVTDNLSGACDSFVYDHTSGDPGIGQLQSVIESWPWDSGGSQHGYVTAYTYGPAGDRQTSTYTTDNGTRIWGYYDYASFGGNASRAPQTLRLLDGSGNPTPEEFHYLYSGSGGLQAATFAMTPAAGYTPSSGSPWYDPSHLASVRARALYGNDAAGRNLSLSYEADSWNGSSYGTSDITGCSYSYSTLSGLKTSATLPGPVSSHTESYGYDPSLDYLTSANYNDGYANSNPVWTYDAAGNRASDSTNPGTWTYDDLNRMSASPGQTYGNDILGNRTSSSSSTLGWDVLNRMTTFTANSTLTGYGYRADGSRIWKARQDFSASTTFAYDGQMGIEDVDGTALGGTTTAVTDYGLGARGIDWMQKTTSSGSVTAFPVYDGHGNMIATLARNGSSFSLNDQRAFDAWGGIRNADYSGDPKGRYCANLGHKQDDESGLTYMRARYYDGATGRFTSQDRVMNGINWFVYCGNDPIGRGDVSGQFDTDDFLNFIGNALLAYGQFLMGGIPTSPDEILKAIDEIRQEWIEHAEHVEGNAGYWKKILKLAGVLKEIADKVKEGMEGGEIASKVIEGYEGYLMCIEGALVLDEVDPDRCDDWGFDPIVLLPSPAGGD